MSRKTTWNIKTPVIGHAVIHTHTTSSTTTTQTEYKGTTQGKVIAHESIWMMAPIEMGNFRFNKTTKVISENPRITLVDTFVQSGVDEMMRFSHQNSMYPMQEQWRQLGIHPLTPSLSSWRVLFPQIMRSAWWERFVGDGQRYGWQTQRMIRSCVPIFSRFRRRHEVHPVTSDIVAVWYIFICRHLKHIYNFNSIWIKSPNTLRMFPSKLFSQ